MARNTTVALKGIMGTMEDGGIPKPSSNSVKRGDLGFRQVFWKSQSSFAEKEKAIQSRSIYTYKAWPFRAPSDLELGSQDAGQLNASET